MLIAIRMLLLLGPLSDRAKEYMYEYTYEYTHIFISALISVPVFIFKTTITSVSPIPK